MAVLALAAAACGEDGAPRGVAPSPTAPSASPTASPTSAGGVVEGVVTADGEPVADAVAVLEPTGARATSGADGTFRLDVPVGGPCRYVTITVTADGYARWRTNDTRVYPGTNHLEVGLSGEEVDDHPPASVGADEGCVR